MGIKRFEIVCASFDLHVYENLTRDVNLSKRPRKSNSSFSMLTSNLKFQGNRLTILKNLGIEPNNILGIIVHILQLLKTYEAAIALIFIYNAYRGLLYSTAAV